MRWHYHCPECKEPLDIDWEWLKEELTCPCCTQKHYPPTPSEDHFAYVSSEQPPRDMETAVVSLRGTTCAAPGCFETYSSLVHRVATARGGHTCVDNLIPLCAAHILAKADRDYDEWAAELRAAGSAQYDAGSAAAGPTLDSWAARSADMLASLRTATRTDLIASNAICGPAPEGMLVRAPFMRFGVRRLLFDYDWQLTGTDPVRLALVAWPHEEPPDLTQVADPDFTGHVTVAEHAGAAGSGRLELTLPEMPLGRWVAAVVATGTTRLTLGDYVLAGTD